MLIDSLQSSPSRNFFLLAGPCVIEGEEMAMNIAEKAIEVTHRLDIPYVFKGSYRKANRSRIDSFTGIGDEKALRILRKVRECFGVPVVTDIHTPDEAAIAAEYVDILQIPAFLCRQTDLLVAAARTGRMVNIKKGQFLSPESMRHAVLKVRDAGNDDVAVTDRGTQFGYQDLIVDFRGIPVMRQYAPVIVDITHSLQQPNQAAGVTGGRPELIETIARAAIATGADGLFLRRIPHPPPPRATVPICSPSTSCPTCCGVLPPCEWPSTRYNHKTHLTHDTHHTTLYLYRSHPARLRRRDHSLVA